MEWQICYKDMQCFLVFRHTLSMLLYHLASSKIEICCKSRQMQIKCINCNLCLW